MPQGSVYYAIGRLSVLEKGAMDSARLERLVQAPDAQQARQILADAGWPQQGDYEAGANEHVRRACQLLRELTTDQRLLDAFLARYDAANLKILLKSRVLGQEPEGLSDCGALRLDTLRHAVSERRYDALGPVYKQHLDALEKRLAVTPDPMDIDVTLDHAYYAQAFSLLSSKQAAARDYFRRRVDLVNLSMALRAMHAAKLWAFLSPMLIAGGSIVPKKWEEAYAHPEKLPQLARAFGPAVYAAAIAAHLNRDKLAAFERAGDDSLLDMFRPFRRSINEDERLIGYLLLRQREAAAVRLVMAGKENGFSQETIRERLRTLYA